MTVRLSRLPAALSLALLLGACGYGWQDPPRVYPPSSANAGNGQVIPGTTVAGPGEHLVQPGDTLYAIGFKNQIDWKDLASWNRIGGDFLIHPGQVIRLTASDPHESIQTQAAPPVARTPGPVAIPPVGAGPLAIEAAPAPLAIPAPAPLPVPSTAVIKAPVAPAVAQVPTAASSPPASVAPGSLRWSWPSKGRVLRGYNLAAGAKGVDIVGELGQPVSAAAAGKVVYSGSALKGYGELIIVKHDDTYLSAYGYNRVRLVKEGDEVRAGQTIAELGMGPEQKPVLHFEIREHGKPVDPLKFLPTP